MSFIENYRDLAGLHFLKVTEEDISKSYIEYTYANSRSVFINYKINDSSKTIIELCGDDSDTIEYLKSKSISIDKSICDNNKAIERLIYNFLMNYEKYDMLLTITSGLDERNSMFYKNFLLNHHSRFGSSGKIILCCESQPSLSERRFISTWLENNLKKNRENS